MDNISSPPFSLGASPFILDSTDAMLDDGMIYDPSRPLEEENSLFAQAFTSNTPFLPESLDTINGGKGSLPGGTARRDDIGRQASFTPSTTSPSGSYRDSSSDTSESLRKSSSESVRSPDPMNLDIMGGDWKDGKGKQSFEYSATINPSLMETKDYGNGDDFMDDLLDFDNTVASSPNPALPQEDSTQINSPTVQSFKHEMPAVQVPILNPNFGSHNKANSVGFLLVFRSIILMNIATLCNAIHERTYNNSISRDVTTFNRHATEPGFFSLRLLQQFSFAC